MSTRGTILLAIGMLILGLLIGGLTGGVAGYLMGQTARPAANQVYPPMMQQPTSRFGQRGFPPAANVLGAARVQDVDPDSPAEKAGLKVGDIITAVGSTKLDADHALGVLIQARQPGEKVDLSVTRGSQTMIVTVELGASSDDKSKAWLGIRFSMVPSGRR